MDPEIKNLLVENLKISRENNELLKKIRNVQRWSLVTKILYWFIIIAIAVGALYFIKPYLNGILNIYSGGISGIDSIKDIGETINSENWRDLIRDVNN